LLRFARNDKYYCKEQLFILSGGESIPTGEFFGSFCLCGELPNLPFISRLQLPWKTSGTPDESGRKGLDTYPSLALP
jgi:hypothetical protein